MIEVDVFWSFSIGASLAACAWRQLSAVDDPFANRYFVYTVLFLSCVFAPSGAYLLFAFPGWETMFFLDLNTLTRHPLLPALFAATNTLNGVVGFYAAWRCVRAGHPLRAHTLWVVSYVCMFSILGLGYARFLYAGDAADWAAGKHYALTSWFVPLRADSVLVALLVMGIPILPGLWVPMWVWAGGCAATDKRVLLRHVVTTACRAVGFVAVCYTVWVICIASAEWREYLSQPPVGPFGYFAPLIGVFVANAAFMVIAFWPLAFMPTAQPAKPDALRTDADAATALGGSAALDEKLKRA